MKHPEYYENYPHRVIIISNFFSIAIYLMGAFIIYQLGSIWLVIYLLYVLWTEIRILRRSCVNCYYYGKYCAFGKGKLSYLLFKKGDSKRFIQYEITWKDVIPDFMVSIIPILVGIVILIIDFNWFLLIMIIILALLTFVGNALIRCSLACKYCKQRKIGCPAEQLFNKTKK
ncbi:MAG: hypothetical protein PHD13_07480 [Methanocellales archaeon]|nr:hypothetical protein [Methanocellales archaeon]MDD3292411.1 hypothetical protein [Methanocellales archaeon]MDD5235997.1 hypothetical protein [Methanocellales archaeon]MDD5485897.1 hypothetical protein [Methanocellales archaeon]